MSRRQHRRAARAGDSRRYGRMDAGCRKLTCEQLESRHLLSGLGDFLNPPAFYPAPSDLNHPNPAPAAAADTQERRDLIYLAGHVPTAEFPVLAQVDTPLLLLYSRRLQGSTQPVAENTIYGTPYGELFSTDGARPHVQAFVESASVARSALEALGMQVTAVTDAADWQVVAGYLPVDAIGDAAHLAGLGVLQASERGTTNAQGAASNQWETVSYADQLKRVLASVDGNEANIDGRIEMGVISDSVNQVGNGVADSQNSNDLPLGNRVQVLDDGPAGGKDEGRAMAELIYDIGPGFNILAHSGTNSAADMAAAYDELRAAGADIITDDISYFTEPVFQDGQIAQAVDNVYLDHGVLVFGAAGNQNGKGYNATWRDDDGNGFHEFADGDETINITLANGEKLRVYLQWNQLWDLGTTDIDVQLFNANLSTLLVDSNDDNNPPLLPGIVDFGFGTPLETLTYTNNTGAAANYQLAFRFEDGTAPDGLVLQMFAPKDKTAPAGNVLTEPYTQNQPAITGNHAATNMFSIGAVRYTPPTVIEGFSSHGPQTLFFGAGGIGVPEVREKPDFVAADRVDTSFFGSSDNDGSGFNDFFGTSAAAPNAAAVAGLMLDAANRRLSYDELSQIFAQTATGTGVGAWDPMFGEGLINALGAGLVARGFRPNEVYAELNPFGDYTARGQDIKLSADTDTDGYAFAFDSDGPVAIGVSGGGAIYEPGLILWNADSGSFVEIDYKDQGFVGDGFANSRIQRELASWGLYQAEVFEANALGPNSESYRLLIDGPDPPITPIGLAAQGDGSAHAAMESQHDTDYFAIVAPETAGNELTVVLTPVAALNGVLTLYDADGEELDRQDAAPAGQAETIVFGNVEKGATYYLRVGAGHYASAGAYDLEVDFEMALPAEMTDAEGFAYFHFDGTSHDTQTFSDFVGSADITADIDMDSFFFAGKVTGDYTVSVTPLSGDVAPLVAVYNAATGELLGATATASQGTTRELHLPLAAWQRYIVAVADDDRSGTGDVEIIIEGPQVLATTPIAIDADGMGSSQDNELNVPEDSDFFRFTAPDDADGTLTLTVSPSWIGLDTAAILLDAAGNELAKSYLPAGGEDDVIAFDGVTPSTTYYLTVLSKDYADQGSYDVSLQFGLVRGSIRGTKFYDLDQDGVFDEGEPGLEDWIVYADLDSDQTFDPAGRIEPDDYADGTLVNDVLPAVHLRAVGQSVINSLIPVVSGRPASTGWKVFGNGWSDRAEWADLDAHFVADFLLPVSRVSLDFIADDAADTGVLTARDRQDQVIAQVATGAMNAGEAMTLTVQAPGNEIAMVSATGGAGHPVQLDNFRFGPGPGEPFALTDIRGQYALEDLPLGSYQVREVLQERWQQTAPAGGEQAVALSLQAPDAAGVDFGNYSRPQVHGIVWEDLNGDGVRDAAEPGLAGWTIFDDWDGDDEPNPFNAATHTFASGEFWFAGIENGSHTIAEVLPPNWAQSYPEGWPKYDVDINNTQLIDGIDFGNYQYSTASGFVFNDLDENGLRDQGEPGLDGWEMFVDLDGDGTRTVGDPWDTVHAGGLFTIMNIPPGDYRLLHAPQVGWTPVVPADDYYEITVISGSSLGYYFFAEHELLDFGDAPPPYPTLLADDGPRHRITRYSLGPFPDEERDGVPSVSADGDDTTGIDDEDGVIFLTALVPGQPAEIRVNAFTNYVRLNAWLDFNRDGDWDDAGERILDQEDLAPFGWQTLSFDVPGWSVPGVTYGRFRVTSTNERLASYTGPADSGEVEDYRVEIENPYNLPLTVPPFEDYGPMSQFGDRNVALTLDSPTDHATWRFTTKQGGPATFTASGDASSGLHPVLALYNGEGDLVAVGSGGPDPAHAALAYVLTPGVDEIYTLLVQDAELDTAGVVQSFFDTPAVTAIDTLTLDAAGLGTAAGTLITHTIPPLADVDYYQLPAIGGGTPDPSGRLAVKVAPLEPYRLEFQLFDGSGNPVGDRVLSPVEGQPAEHVYTGLPGGQSYFVAVFPQRFEDHPAGGDYRVEVHLDTYDFGDAPASYATLVADNGPSHLIVPGLYLGSRVDNEWEGRPGASADGDDTAGSDDEDGVVFVVGMSPGVPTDIEVTASAAGKLDAWVDFGGDGDFSDAGDHVLTGESLVAGVNTLTIRVPIGAALGSTYARFRYSSAGGLSFNGPAGDGEVEDYAVEIAPSGEIRGTVWHDVNTDGTHGSGEPGLAGRTVFLDDDHDGQFDSSTEQWVQTDSGGNYAFLDVPPGNYNVAQLMPDGWSQTFPVVVPECVYVLGGVLEPRDIWWNLNPPDLAMFGVIRLDFNLDAYAVDFPPELQGDFGVPRDIEIGPGGDVYVGFDGGLWEGQDRILQFTYDMDYVRSIDLPVDRDEDGDPNMAYPAGFDVLPDGSLLVAQPNSRQIVQLNPDGSIAETFTLPLFQPLDAGMTSDGWIVFSEHGFLNVRPDDLIWLTSDSGTFLQDVAGTVFAERPWSSEALEVSDGSLFMVEADHVYSRVLKLDAAGNLVATFDPNAGHVDALSELYALAVARNEVPYGEGPVRVGAAPQGFIAVGAAGAQLVGDVTVTRAAETSLLAPASPVNNGRGVWNVTLTPAQVVTGVDFGIVQECTASGVKFNDLDGDGIHDTAEPGLDGWVVWADLDDDGVRDGREPFATTSGGGLFTLEGIPPGTYKIREEAQAGWAQTAPAAGYHEVQFTSGSTVTGLEFGNRQLFHVFVVNSTADPGDGTPDAAELTLREAITAANAAANSLASDWIVFALPADDPGHVYYHDDGVPGQVSAAQIVNTTAASDSLLVEPDPDWPHSWFTIRLAYALPSITEAAVIDGYTQPGARANRLPIGSDAVLRIELDGGNAGNNASGLWVTGNDTTIRGLAINRFRGSAAQNSGFGIYLDLGDNNTIEGNFLGTDVSGTLDLGNATDGLYGRGSSGNRIGGTTLQARNVISGNNNNGVDFFLSSSSGNLVQGNYIGVNSAATAALGNTGNGVAIQGGASFNTIGGTALHAGNVISGNSGHGIRMFGFGGNNLVQGNRIGTDAAGGIDLGNSQNGIRVEQSNNTIGGATPGARNVISGNNSHGVQISGTAATGNLVQGNFIGVDSTGAGALGNGGSGVQIVSGASNNTIGGAAGGAGNVLSANGRGVSIQQSADNQVLGNLIGVQADGTSPLGNMYTGVEIIDASDNLIGGTESGAGNTIAYSGLDGVYVLFNQSGAGNAILGNRIFSNAGLGIDLSPNNVTPNDPGDTDTGANNLQNFPVLTLATATGSSTAVQGSLNSTPDTAFRIELFANQAADPSGFGEGQTYLGSIDVLTDTAGNVGFQAAFPVAVSPGQVITATATVLRSGGAPGFGDTSEFSQAVAVETAANTGEIHGTVWHDVNTSGARETGEPGLAGWTVFLDEDDDLTLDSNETYTTTDAAGNYAFSDLVPSNYNVAQVLLPNWLQTMPVLLPEWVYVSGFTFFADTRTTLNWVEILDFHLNLVDTVFPDSLRGGSPTDIEIGPGGDVYVLLEGGLGGTDRIVQFSYDMRFVREIDLEGDIHGPGFDVLADGSLLVTNWLDEVQRLNPDGSLAETFEAPYSPWDVGMTSDGTVVFNEDGMLNVRTDDLYWASGPTTELRDAAGTVFEERRSSTEALELRDERLVMMTPTKVLKLTPGGFEMASFDVEDVGLEDRLGYSYATALAVARHEAPFGDGPVRGGAAPQAGLRSPSAGAAHALSLDAPASGAVPTGRGNWNVVVEAGLVVEGVDFGDVELSTASGVKFNDLDGDGARDAGEPGLDGWIVWADLDDDGVRDGREPFATTANGGLYTIAGIPPGTYKIREEAQPGWSPTDPAAGYHEIHFLPGSMIENLDFGNRLLADFGDAPASYATLFADNGAYHALVSSVHLGNLIDPEPDGQPSPAADKDDLANLDDEDGVVFTSPLLTGQLATVEVAASIDGVLNAWVDFNRDGDFADDGEQVFVDKPLAAGVNHLNFGVPIWAIDGETFARFRFSTQAGLSFDGPAPDGEVEDYPVLVEKPGEIHGGKWNDLDADGLWDEGEPGLQGWTIFLDADGDGLLDEGEIRDTTDANGHYAFIGLDPGRYTVAEVCQEGWVQTFPAPFTERASVTGAGNQAEDANRGASISGDGRFVAFESLAGNLVPGDANGASDIFVLDRQTGSVERVSVDAAGHSVNGPSVEPSISGDGRLVAFQSFATTLVPGDSNLVGDIFVFDRQTGTIQRVSVSSAGDQADGQSFEPSISGDGRYVAFGSDATNLVPGDTNGASDIFVFDCQTGTIERISVDGAGNEANGVSFAPSISGDGRYVAFGSLAANLVPGDTNGWVDIFVFDRQTQAIERVSVTAAGGQTNGISGAPSISNDGRYVAFESFATNLVPGDGNGTSDIFVFDRQAGTIQRVSVTDAGNEADGESRDPSISGDGRYVAFASDAANLVPGDGNGAGDVFVFDRQAGSIERVSVTGAGGQANAPSFEPSINDDGRFVAFQSQASNLVAWDSNNALDVFVRATMPFYSVTLIGEEVVDHLDFGNAQRVGRIEGLKYHDLDNDGVRDPGEPGLAGWIIYVDLNDNGVHEAAEPFTTTGADGVFALVGDISQGDFKVREEPQPGWAQTQPAQGYYDLQFLPGAVFTGLVFGNRTAIDYGDAPLPYPTLAAAGGASHLLQPGFHLGNVVDDEPDGQPAVGADGDDTHAVDDEDGVRFLTPLIPGQMARIEVTASAAGALDAWIDFNADGDWADVGERIFTAQPLVPGPNLLNFMVPSSARGGQTYSRFRFSSQGVPSYDGPGPAGEVEDYPLVVAGEIGPIDFWEAGGLVLDGQNLYFGFSTVHPGFLTLEVLRPEPPKSARIRLYDQDPRQNTGLTPLAGSQLLDGNQRIDWVTAAGQHYYVELYGLNPDFDLRVANLVWHDGTDVTVFGTTGDDRFEFDAAHSRTISINGVIYHFADEQVSSVGFDGGEGHDVVSMYDSPGDETLEAWSSETAIFTNGPADSVPDFTVTLHGYNELHVYAPSTGHDVAILHGTPGNDKFKSEPMENYAKIYGGAQYNRVKFFDEVDVYSSSGMELAPGADGGKDLARLWDSNGSDTFRGGLGLSHYQGPSFNVRVHDYSQVIAYSKFDGVDVATLVDSALKDEFQGKPHKSEIFDLVTGGEVYKVTGRGFDVVHGQALNQEGAAQNGGRDKAKLWGTPWDDFVEAADDWLRYRFSRDAGTMEQLYEILAFESVTVRKTEGGSDTKDVADPLLYELLFEEGWGP